MNLDREKQLAAKEAVKYVKSGMTVGLGTGSTAAHMVEELGQLVQNGLEIVGVPSSENTKKLEKTNTIDVYIDGADEFDPYMQLIKGGGGALLREKILTYNSDFVIIIADSQKEVKRLGDFKLPVETIPFATKKIEQSLKKMGLQPILRVKDSENFVTDEGNFILDLNIEHISNIQLLETNLKQIPGVVETGLFLDMADIIIIGQGETTITLKK